MRAHGGRKATGRWVAEREACSVRACGRMKWEVFNVQRLDPSDWACARAGCGRAMAAKRGRERTGATVFYKAACSKAY
eukprot:3778341-Pleurochrysis_carterae.AAC.1